MTRVLDPLSAQVPTFDPRTPGTEPASALRPLIMRGTTVPNAIQVPTAPEVAWDTELQLPVDRATGLPTLGGHTNGSTSTTTDRDSNGPDTDTDARDD